jgi:hypothetical protein
VAFWNAKKPTLHTNAPRHWPAIEAEHVGQPAGLIMIGAQFAALHRPPQSSIAFMQELVYEDGILRIPIVVQEGAQKTCDFVYGADFENSAAHYSGVRTLLRSRENAAAVYYSLAAIEPAKPGTVLQPIDTPFFSKGEIKEGDAFALWWASAEASTFGGSDEKGHLDRWFEATDGYGYLLLTSFLRVLEMVKDTKTVYALPSQPLLQPVIGPGGTRMLLHASAQEGLFLACHESTPGARRRILARLLADFAVDYRKAIDGQKIPSRDDERGRGLATWRTICEEARVREEGSGAELKVHSVRVNDGQPQRSPHATTAAERAAAPQPPGRDELDFGMDIMDRVIARLKKRPATGSSESQLGMPNFFPIVAVKAGNDVFERHLPYEEHPVALMAAGRALDEWPEADVVAVIGDGAIRENGHRVDIFDVRVENRRAGRGGKLFQRYRVEAGGAVELIGRPTATPGERFLVETSAARTPAPHEALVALARKALDDIVGHIKILDPSGLSREEKDADGPLFMPSAFVEKADENAQGLMVRFALQGPVTAAASCLEMLKKEPARSVVFYVDDLVEKNGADDRRLRLCVQRREDAGMAIFQQRYATPRHGPPFTLQDGLEFVRWTGSMWA